MQKKDQLEKEKCLYALELQLPDYEEENIIWAEDLFDVDIIVYTGHLDSGRVEGYSAEDTEDYRLLIVRHKKKDVIMPLVRADTKKNCIYLSVKNFDQWWPDIEKSIANYLSVNHIPGKPIDRVNRDNVRTWTVDDAGSKDVEDRAKKSMIDTRAYLYFSIGNNGVLHDRKCGYIVRAKSTSLTGYQAFQKGMKPCLSCGYTVAIRELCYPTERYIDAIEKIFKESAVTFTRVKQFVFLNHMHVDFVSLSELSVKVNEDTWRVKKGSAGIWELWHNNYHVLVEGVRCFDKGFHDQGTRGSLTFVLNAAVKYKWNQTHLKTLPVEALEKEKDKTASEINIMGCKVQLDAEDGEISKTNEEEAAAATYATQNCDSENSVSEKKAAKGNTLGKIKNTLVAFFEIRKTAFLK